MKISDDVLTVLSAVTTDHTGKAVTIVGTLDRKMYVKVNDVLEALGGKWNRKAKAHLFTEDAAELINATIIAGEVTTARDVGYFPTPEPLADQLVAMAEIRDMDRCLEPSAGDGAIVKAMLRRQPRDIVVCELDPKRRQRLALLDHKVLVSVADDFMQIRASDPPFNDPQWWRFDVVVMNPPFARVGIGDHLDHVSNAYSLLTVGGRLVSVLPYSVLFRVDRRYSLFRDWVKSIDGELKDLPALSFRSSGTDVSTCVLRVTKR